MVQGRPLSIGYNLGDTLSDAEEESKTGSNREFGVTKESLILLEHKYNILLLPRQIKREKRTLARISPQAAERTNNFLCDTRTCSRWIEQTLLRAFDSSCQAMSASLPGNRDLPASQYNLNTYWGRVKQSAEISDPR